MKSGEVRVVTAGTGSRSRRILYLIPLFLAAVSIGFLLNFTSYESLATSDLHLTFAHLPQKLNSIKNWQSNTDPEFLKPLKQQSVNDASIHNKLWQEPTLLNLNFTWLKNNETICHSGNTELKLMPILIHTARSHFEERRVIRKSWGSIADYKNWTIRPVFLLGEADRGLNPQINQKEFETQEAQLNQEQIQHGDLVMGSFIDSYKNLTYKHLMGYKWILNFCQNAQFILKGDDDVFLDVLKFINARRSELEILHNENKSDEVSELYCHTFAGAKPIREVGSKWFASVEQWPDEYYPDYCSGWAYGITVNLIEQIYSVSNLINFYWIDDIFVTGALLEVVRRVYHYEPEITHLWGKITMDTKFYKQFCKAGDIESKREFEAVAPVSRGNGFEGDMMCLWNKTLYDSKHSIS